MPTDRPVHLLDTNAIIEAVRVGVWGAVAGGLAIETVEACREECRRGDRLSDGYVSVSEADLNRLAAVHAVSEEERAGLLLETDASSLDRGELDLHAHARVRPNGGWTICSPDLAAVRLGVAMEWGDRLVSLEELVRSVGARPSPALRPHFTRRWLSRTRTRALLGS